MKKILFIILCIVFCIFILSGCERYSSFLEDGTRGVAVINNSLLNIKSMSINQYDNSETGMNADGSPIKNGEYLFFHIDQNKSCEFSITITDINDNQYTSQLFVRDFSNDSVYYIYIINTDDGLIKFETTKQI